MSPDQIDTAIAEFCGWTNILPEAVDGRRYGTRPNSEGFRYRVAMIPSYHKCLNAMAEAESGLDVIGKKNHLEATVRIVSREDGPTASAFYAKAIQRAEALLRTIGKWQEPPA